MREGLNSCSKIAAHILVTTQEAPFWRGFCLQLTWPPRSISLIAPQATARWRRSVSAVGVGCPDFLSSEAVPAHIGILLIKYLQRLPTSKSTYPVTIWAHLI